MKKKQFRQLILVLNNISRNVVSLKPTRVGELETKVTGLEMYIVELEQELRERRIAMNGQPLRVVSS